MGSVITMSEVMIKEVQIVASGFAPEFGQTTGLVYNAITPSGTNVRRGSASYRFQRKDFAAFPFFFQGPETEDRRPNTRVTVETIEIGGPPSIPPFRPTPMGSPCLASRFRRTPAN